MSDEQVDYAALAKQYGGAATENTPPKDNPKMSAGQPGLAFPGDAEAVTVGDVLADPAGSIAKIGTNLKREFTDPKTWLSLAAAYFAPKALNAVAPVIARAAAGAGAAVEGPSAAKDMLTVFGGERVNAGIRLATRAANALRPPVEAPVAPAAPVPDVPAEAPSAPYELAIAAAKRAHPPMPRPDVPQEAPVTAGPAPGAPEPSAAAEPAARPGNTYPDQKALNEQALAARRAAYQASQQQAQSAAPDEAVVAALPKLKLTADEMKFFMDQMKRGAKPIDALQSIAQQRALIEQLGLASPAVADVRFPKGMRGKPMPIREPR